MFSTMRAATPPAGASPRPCRRPCRRRRCGGLGHRLGGRLATLRGRGCGGAGARFCAAAVAPLVAVAALLLAGAGVATVPGVGGAMWSASRRWSAKKSRQLSLTEPGSAQVLLAAISSTSQAFGPSARRSSGRGLRFVTHSADRTGPHPLPDQADRLSPAPRFRRRHPARRGRIRRSSATLAALTAASAPTGGHGLGTATETQPRSHTCTG